MLALGLCSRLAGVALFGDQVIAMITVTWATGINSVATPRLPAELGARSTRTRRGPPGFRPVEP